MTDLIIDSILLGEGQSSGCDEPLNTLVKPTVIAGADTVRFGVFATIATPQPPPAVATVTA